MKLRQVTGKTATQIRTMADTDFAFMLDQLEDRNYHNEYVMVLAARHNQVMILKAMEAMDDMYQALGNMPQQLIDLRCQFTKQLLRKHITA